MRLLYMINVMVYIIRIRKVDQFPYKLKHEMRVS